MPGHDPFLELGALAAIGEITAPEHDELAAHLRECAECREACAEYSTILRQDLPQANPQRKTLAGRKLPRTPDAELREHFLARVRAIGLEFSAEVDRPVREMRRQWWGISRPIVTWAAAAAVIVITISSAIMVNRAWTRRTPTYVAAVAAVPTAPAGVQPIQPVAQVKPAEDPRSAKMASEALALSAELKQKDEEIAASSKKIEMLELQLAQAQSDQSASLTARQRDEGELADLRSQVKSLQGTNATSVAEMVELQDRIHSMTTALQQQSDKMEMERQMAFVSSDVRQLMGARNLHIVDVQDVNGTGKSSQSFGRVFYAEGQSLVFYAFDLSNGKPGPSKFYFKAWGQQEGSAASVHNLGTFAIDDREQQRWVLKITDPSLLKGIDSVFVTAEATGDRKQPEGKRLLYAFLAGKANHP